MRYWPIVGTVMMLSSCGVRENIRPNSPLDLKSESAILFLGFTPKYKVALIRSPVEGGVWQQAVLHTPDVTTTPENGYILVKVRPTVASERMSVSLVVIDRKVYAPCPNSLGPTFALKPGVVNYLGDLSYAVDENHNLKYTYEVGEDRAKKFLREHYPGYIDLFETQPMIPMKIANSVCHPGAQFIPIVVPTRR
jgi:hypothetical protein